MHEMHASDFFLDFDLRGFVRVYGRTKPIQIHMIRRYKISSSKSSSPIHAGSKKTMITVMAMSLYYRTTAAPLIATCSRSPNTVVVRASIIVLHSICLCSKVYDTITANRLYFDDSSLIHSFTKESIVRLCRRHTLTLPSSPSIDPTRSILFSAFVRWTSSSCYYNQTTRKKYFNICTLNKTLHRRKQHHHQQQPLTYIAGVRASVRAIQ
jgi:hypothetical protein